MPDGMTHFGIGLAAGTALTAGVALLYDGPIVRSFVIGSAIALLWIGPDLDQQGTTRQEHIIYEIPLVGGVLGFFNQWFWWGYAKLFPHRGFSHSKPWWTFAVLGTLSRMFYLALLLGFWLAVLGALTGRLVEWGDVTWRILVRELQPALFIGWWSQDLLHVLADWFVKV